MLRVALTIVLPLVLPSVAYVLWMIMVRAERVERVLRWRGTPWFWLAGAGGLLLAAVLFTITVRFGTPERGVYVAPRYQDGQIVPGHVEPASR